ncbi:MAG TPA: hypothetical protein VIU62_05465 [Chloroflexota bacterium]
MLPVAVTEAPATASGALSGRAEGSNATGSAAVVPWVCTWVLMIEVFEVVAELVVPVEITAASGDELMVASVVWLIRAIEAGCAEGGLAADAFATGRRAVGIIGARSSKSASANGNSSTAAAGLGTAAARRRSEKNVERRTTSTGVSERAEDTARRGIFKR